MDMNNYMTLVGISVGHSIEQKLRGIIITKNKQIKLLLF